VAGRGDKSTYIGTAEDRQDVVGTVTFDSDEEPAVVVARRILLVMEANGLLAAVGELASCTLASYEACPLELTDMTGLARACASIRAQVEAGPSSLQATVDGVRLGLSREQDAAFTRTVSARSDEIARVLSALEAAAQYARDERQGLFLDL